MKGLIIAGVGIMIACNNEIVSLAVLTLFSVAGLYFILKERFVR